MKMILKIRSLFKLGSFALCFSCASPQGPFVSENTLHATRQISSIAPAVECKALFEDTLVKGKKIFSPLGLQKLRAPSGRIMVYDFKPPAQGQRVMLFIHGLGDDLFALQKIAEKAEQDGFGILRIDLNGHGATLEEYLETHNNILPSEFDYRDNVDDIKGLLKALKIKSLHIVGHSLGGGIALKLAEELPKKLVFSVHAMAPYVQRIDKFIAQKMSNPDFLISSGEVNVEKFGMPRRASSIFDPLFQLTWNMTRSFKFVQDLSNAMLGLDKMKDLFLDPLMQQFMEKAYRSYFLKALNKNEFQLTQKEKIFLNARVDSAILVTKGVRGLDYLDETTEIGKFPTIVQIIGGAQDMLVVPEQLKQFSLRLNQWRVVHEMVQVEGPDSSHLFPQTMPDEVYDLILESITRPR